MPYIDVGEENTGDIEIYYKVFSEADLAEDLKKINVPTLVMHGDDDQIVPIADSAMPSSKLITKTRLKVYKGAPRGMPSTLKDQINQDLLAFFKGYAIKNGRHSLN